MRRVITVTLVIGIAILTQRFAMAGVSNEIDYWFHSNTVQIRVETWADAFPKTCTVASSMGAWTSKVDAATNYSQDLNHPYPSGAGTGLVKLCGAATLYDPSLHSHFFFDDGINNPGALASDYFTADTASYKELEQTNNGTIDMSQTGTWNFEVESGNSTQYSDWPGDRAVTATDNQYFQVQTSCP